MASRPSNDVALGPNNSFCFNYTDPRKAVSANLPQKVKELFNIDRDPYVTEVSCLALGPDGRYAAVYKSQEQWFISEHHLRFNTSFADANYHSGGGVATKIDKLVIGRISARWSCPKERCQCQDCLWSSPIMVRI